MQLGQTSYLVLCYIGIALIYNETGSRLLHKVDLKSENEDNKFWFTCSTKAVGENGEDFIALATNDGRIYKIQVDRSGIQFS